MIDALTLIRDLSTVVIAIVAVISMVSVLKYQVNRNEKDAEKGEGKVENLSKDVTSLLTELKILSREQALVNKFTADTLGSMNKKIEEVEHVIAEHGQLVSLVRELIKKVDKVNVEP